MGKLKKCKLIIPLVIFVSLIVISASGCSNNREVSNSDQTKNKPVQSQGQSNITKIATNSTISPELYKEILITVLYPYIQESVTNYYGKNVYAAPYVVHVMEARRPTAEEVYELILEVRPYTGAHNQVGIDHITLRISPEKIGVVKFEHITSLPLPPH